MKTVTEIFDSEGNFIKRKVTFDYSKSKTNPGKTQQHFKKQCDINNIVSAHLKKGLSPHLNPNVENYGFASAIDLQDAMNVVTYANQGFAQLPSDVRNKFDNDPRKFVEFIDTEGHQEQLKEWGLLRPSIEAADPQAAGAGDPPPADQPPADPSPPE